MSRVSKIAIIAGVLILLLVVAMYFLGASRRRADNTGARQQNFEHQSENQSKTSNAFESQKKYLRENGIDCTHENNNSTYRSLAIDPQDPEIIYVGIEGRGVYKSQDKGATWKKIIKGLVAYPDSNDKSEFCFPDLSYIYIDPANTKRLLLIVGDITTAYIDWVYGETGGIWESIDAGENWHQIIKGEINVAGSGSLAVDPKNPDIMYYPVNPDPPTFLEAPIKTSLNKKGSVYKSTDGGKSWQELEMPMLPGMQAMRIFIDPNNSSHLLFFTQSHDHKYNEQGQVQAEVFLHKQHSVLESFDTGKTWTTFGDKLPDPYGAIFDGDVSTNNFSHWIVRSFVFGPEFPGETTVQKSFYSLDGGKSFSQTPIYIWTGRYNPHDKDGNHLLGYAQLNSKIVESKDAGKTWQDVNTPTEVSSRKAPITNFVWDPKDANTVYMNGERGMAWRSSDSGKTWTKILSLETLPKL